MSEITDERIAELDELVAKCVFDLVDEFGYFSPEEQFIFWEQVSLSAENERRAWQIALK